MHDRSPIIIPRDRFSEWLDPDLAAKDDIQHLLDSLPEPSTPWLLTVHTDFTLGLAKGQPPGNTKLRPCNVSAHPHESGLPQQKAHDKERYKEQEVKPLPRQAEAEDIGAENQPCKQRCDVIQHPGVQAEQHERNSSDQYYRAEIE
ncbi:SOS response-associated peptidase [Arthrobacter sp. SLBN-100]|uniref:SOS response-associated peptidase n=1 Tax=Arthrobacter sp. SLBN-100 TaxID=2768450 RepID=UPI001F2F229E|nr:SOS response-associated peptidase [Arthrobacter sp. SLBN-100]